MSSPEQAMSPVLYHAHHSLHAEDLPFWLSLAQGQAGPFLELGCGTGRVLLALAQAGHRVFGLDNDPAMLAFLLRNTPIALRPRVKIIQADFTSFHLAQQFGLILLPCNTYSTLGPDARQSVLECVRQHLQPGGVFAVSLPNPRLLRELPAHATPEIEEIFAHPLDGEPVQVSSGWRRTSRHLIIDWHYDHLLPDGSVQRVSARVKHFLIPAEAYLEELHRAGFTSITTFGDFDHSGNTNDSPHLIILAQR